MSNYRLIGITTPQAADKLNANGATLAGTWLYVTRYPGLAALQVVAEKPGIFTTRNAVLEQELLFQRQLEAAHLAGPLVPAVFANPLLDETEALRVMAVGHARFKEALEIFAGVKQYQITVSWNPAIAIAHCTTQPDFQAALSQAGDDNASRGAVIKALMEGTRARVGATAAEKLRAASSQLMLEPLGSETMILNLVVLVESNKEAAFDAALKDVDASFPDLVIKHLGPLPPVSFASVTIERPKLQDIAKAKLTLNIDAVEAEALKSAYRNAMKLAHPDMAGGTQAKAAVITKAFRLLEKFDEAISAGGDRAKPILIDLVNAGGERWAA